MAKNKKSNWYKIERSRETRLWLGQVVVPGITVGCGLLQIPEVKEFAKAKLDEAKWKLKKATNAIRDKVKGP